MQSGRRVDFRSGLDLAPFVAHAGGETGRADLTYDLEGVVNHFGAAGYGHYTAFVRDLFAVGGPGPWLRCDDSSVAEVPAEDEPVVGRVRHVRRDAARAGRCVPGNVRLCHEHPESRMLSSDIRCLDWPGLAACKTLARSADCAVCTLACLAQE